MENTHKVGLGLAALGRPSYINLGHYQDISHRSSKAQMEQRTHAMLDTAWDHGIRYFDTARSYGLAEKFLSTWLEKNPAKAKQSIISSKWGYIYKANWNKNAETHEIKDHSVKNFLSQWQETFALLNNHLDIYLIHSATFNSGVLNNINVLKKLSLLKERGVRVGISVSGEDQDALLEQALNIAIDGKSLFSAYQVTFNILETSTSKQLKEANKQGALIIAKECLANGLLTNRNNNHDNFYMHTIKDKARELNTTVDALCMAFVTQQSFIDIALSGAVTTKHLHSNLLANNLNLPKDTLAELSTLSLPPKEYWDNRSKLLWN